VTREPIEQAACINAAVDSAVADEDPCHACTRS
jgi:hypothetical protein